MQLTSFRETPFFAESWNVAFREKGTGEILHDIDTPFTVINNNFRYWAADPFVFEREGKVYIFAELYDYILRRGILGYCELTAGKAGKWKPVICEDYHLSYPCITEFNGKLYLMPESAAGGVLTVYEAVRFPDKWGKRTVICRDVRFADTTPFPCSGKCLALTYQIDDPENPQLTLIDLKRQLTDESVSGAVPLYSRPAGYVFERDGQLIRPAQISWDTGKGYGKGLVFYYAELDEEHGYSEQAFSEIYPVNLKYSRSIYLDGMHTYNSSEHYEVIDIKTRRFNVLNFVMRIAGKFLRYK